MEQNKKVSHKMLTKGQAANIIGILEEDGQFWPVMANYKLRFKPFESEEQCVKWIAQKPLEMLTNMMAAMATIITENSKK